MKTWTFSIEGMSCGGCVSRVERALADAPGVSGVSANLAERTARVVSEANDPHELLKRLDAAGYPATTTSRTLSVPGLSCGSCVSRVEAAARSVSGILDANANLAERSLTIKAINADAIATLHTALRQAGYPADETGAPDAPEPNDEIAELKRATLLAAIFTLPLFVLEMGGHLVPAFHMWLHELIGMRTLWVIQFGLALVVMAGPGTRFHLKGWPSLLRGTPDMNALVAVGTGAAFAYSTIATFVPVLLPETARAVYFEAAALIVTLILTGRWLEARARARTGDAIRALSDLQPPTALRQNADGSFEETPLAAVQPGDILELRAGAKVPVDGMVSQGTGSVDESMLTGEPLPVLKSKDDELKAGTINGSARLIMTATHVGADTALARIIEMVRAAQSTKLPVQDLVNRIAAWFVPVVLALAVVTAIIWIALTGDVTQALVASVSVLIVACPCAMGLAVPVSIMVGMGRAARQGILFRDGSALQRLATVRSVAFDKTGTLTKGAPVVSNVTAADGISQQTVLELAGAAERGSNHPLAQAILDASTGILPTATDLVERPGFGITARVDGAEIALGNQEFMRELGIAQPSVPDNSSETLVHLARDGAWTGTLHISDTIRPEAADAVTWLSAAGIETALISGDRKAAAQSVAAQIGLSRVHAEQLPDGKIASLKDLPEPTAFVGDGINDAPVLAASDVGIALGSGTDAAIGAAQVVLMRPDLNSVPAALRLSRATMRNIYQNLFWAFGYNVALLPVAAGGLVPFGGPMLSPALAAGAMALSSVFVLSNALRLRRAG
ncbi:heavy metal translocating P-type ATPase [Pontivivens insulae]|uniref:heavy metal translocating P-type ATPase n=1 Tax=Pontivivens insulae TaxID=1639689 RepID=UPI0027B9ED1C|nr:heavy metal translocating P-type ATPase [Pontivivens insulae]